MGEETNHVRNILRSSHETDIFQSFVRVELGDESESKDEVKKKMLLIQQQQEENLVETDEKNERVTMTRGASEEIPLKKTSFNQLSKDMKLQGKRKKRIRNNQPAECYTDKDRAAAVNMGSRDIKQSLKMKQREDRTKALMMPDEADPSALIALGCHELRSGDVKIAVGFFNKALECNPEEINALIVRSKCYLLLGQPKLALEDAEMVFKSDRNNIKAIFQKAEALYHLGDFEHSLMYYHRGLRIRPDLAGFRLGVQKTKEAIENTIGISARPKTGEKRNVVAEKQIITTLNDKETLGKKYIEMTRNRLNISNPTNHTDAERKNSKRLLGELYLDKEYFENLLKHPDFKCLNKDNEDITLHAKEAIEFLNKRQEFWRQQKPLVIAPQKKKK